MFIGIRAKLRETAYGYVCEMSNDVIASVYEIMHANCTRFECNLTIDIHFCVKKEVQKMTEKAAAAVVIG